MRAARGILIGMGLATIGFGGYVLLTEVPPTRYVGIAAWVVAAIVLHDGVIAPIAVAIGLGAVRVRGRIGGPGVSVAQGALLVGAILTAVALPAVIASTLGNPNPTILVGAYALSLTVVWLVVLAVVVTSVWRGARITSASAETDAPRADSTMEP